MRFGEAFGRRAGSVEHDLAEPLQFAAVAEVQQLILEWIRQCHIRTITRHLPLPAKLPAGKSSASRIAARALEYVVCARACGRRLRGGRVGRNGTADFTGALMPATDIVIRGAREHNLRSVDVTLPRNKLICLTGVSGSGKSSLAFDTLYAEGQRRYVESLSTFARQFLGQMPKPEVDHISGLSPSISISQKSSGNNPRSTVGTITEIYDFLRVLYARVGRGHCFRCGRPITAQTREQIIGRILELPSGNQFSVLAPLIRGQKGEYKDLFEDLRKQGFVRARVDGRVVSLTDDLSLDRQMRHSIEVVVDRLTAGTAIRGRLSEAV